MKTTWLDEFNRIDVIKGQGASGSLTAVGPRRQAVVAGLKTCPVGQWIAVDSLFRLLRSEHPFVVTRDSWKLYIADSHYGSLGYEGDHAWENTQGRFVLAFLFEYAATLGLLDVAYITPENARNDFRDRWGTDDFSCLSRYDGLLYFRINPLGAWCLRLADTYAPPATLEPKIFKVLPNLDVVSTGPKPSAGDVFFLERFADRQSDSVWRLSREKILSAVEQGLRLADLQSFLTSRSLNDLPKTAVVFLDDLEDKSRQLEDLGDYRLIACKDAVLAQILGGDRRLSHLCLPAGDRHLAFKASDEDRVRRALKELGHVLPPRN